MLLVHDTHTVGGIERAKAHTRPYERENAAVQRTARATQDIDCAVGESPCLDPFETGGFSTDEAEITSWDFSPTCHGGFEDS